MSCRTTAEGRTVKYQKTENKKIISSPPTPQDTRTIGSSGRDLTYHTFPEEDSLPMFPQ